MIAAAAIAAIGVVMVAMGCAASPDRHDRVFGIAEREGESGSWTLGNVDALFPRDRYFVGLGTCGPEVSETERLDCAIQRALGQAVAMVRQHVSVEVRRRTEHHRTTGAEGGVETTVRSTYERDGSGQAELTVEDAAPRRRGCSPDGRCHALIALDRGRLAARSRQRIAQLEAKVVELLDRAEKSDTISAIEQLAAASRLFASIDQESELLAAAAGPNALPPSAWDRFSHVRSKRLDSILVCLSSSLPDPAPQLVFARAHQDLSARGFARVAIAREPDCPVDALSVTFEGAANERKDESRLWVFEVRGTVVVRADVRTLGKGLPVVGRGVARFREQARIEAQDDSALNVQQSLARLLDPTGASAP